MVIDQTPLITDVRRKIYKKYLRLRKHMTIDKSYQLVLKNNYDLEAIERLQV